MTRDTVNRPNRLSQDEMSALVIAQREAKTDAGRIAARNAMMEGNLGLVHLMARRTGAQGHELDEAVQDGCFGLMRACEMYDPSRRVKFSAYATYWIKQAIQRGRQNACYRRPFRLPVYIQNAFTAATKRISRPAHEKANKDYFDRCEAYTVPDLGDRGPGVVEDPDAADQEEPSGRSLDEIQANEERIDPEVAAILAREMEALPDQDRGVLRIFHGFDEPGVKKTPSDTKIGLRLGINRKLVREAIDRSHQRLREKMCGCV